MLSSGEKDSEIGEAVPGRGNLATSSGFITSPSFPCCCCFAESLGILADGTLVAGLNCPLEVKASAPPSKAPPTYVARRETTCITGVRGAGRRLGEPGARPEKKGPDQEVEGR